MYCSLNLNFNHSFHIEYMETPPIFSFDISNSEFTDTIILKLEINALNPC